jgi:hypothetical protein
VRSIPKTDVKFLDQPRLAEPRLADNQYQLPIALSRSPPAPHQHGDLLVTTDEWCEMALTSPASPAASADDSEQRHRLRYAFEFMAAALLDDEETGDLTLHSCCHNDRTRLGQRLCPRRDVWHFAEYLARRINHHWPNVDRDARREYWLPGALVVAVQVAASARWMDSAARTARSTSFSWAIG